MWSTYSKVRVRINDRPIKAMPVAAGMIVFGGASTQARFTKSVHLHRDSVPDCAPSVTSIVCAEIPLRDSQAVLFDVQDEPSDLAPSQFQLRQQVGAIERELVIAHPYKGIPDELEAVIMQVLYKAQLLC
jgi:hypothetical protein